MKLKPKMLLGIGIPLVVVFIVMGLIINSMARSALSDISHSYLAELTQHYANRITVAVDADRTAVNTTAINWGEAMPTGESMKKGLAQLTEGRQGSVCRTPGRHDRWNDTVCRELRSAHAQLVQGCRRFAGQGCHLGCL